MIPLHRINLSDFLKGEIMGYTKHFSTKKTDQRSKIPGTAQIKNNAGGYVFKISPQKQLERFLILGSEGGTHYVNEKTLTIENAQSIVNLAQTDGVNTVNTIVETSVVGKAPSNNPAIFALAICCTFGDQETKSAAYNAISKVCRTGTHLFDFCNEIQNLRGWSRGLRKGVSKFYLNKSDEKLAYQVIKYRQRNGFTHRDVLRLCHASALTKVKNGILRYAVGKESDSLHPTIDAFERVQDTDDIKEVIKLVQEFKLPWEALKTEHLKDKRVWSALLPDMPITALVRNLGRMTSNGTLVSALGENTKTVVSKLRNKEAISKSRIHPMTLLVAMKTYANGCGTKGSLRWEPISKIVSALEDAFYLSFENVESSGENYYIGLDVSGSMGFYNISGLPITPREASAVMAMVTLRCEENCEIKGFTGQMQKLGITEKDSLDSVIRKISGLRFGNTDCSLPMLDALALGIKVDKFVIYTDNETWFGNVHPVQALNLYRKKINPDAKLIVCAMTPTKFSIADESDTGMLDIAGFSTTTPKIISEF